MVGKIHALQATMKRQGYWMIISDFALGMFDLDLMGTGVGRGLGGFVRGEEGGILR